MIQGGALFTSPIETMSTWRKEFKINWVTEYKNKPDFLAWRLGSTCGRRDTWVLISTSGLFLCFVFNRHLEQIKKTFPGQGSVPWSPFFHLSALVLPGYILMLIVVCLYSVNVVCLYLVSNVMKRGQ